MPDAATIFEILAVLAVVGVVGWMMFERAVTWRGGVVLGLLVAQAVPWWINDVISVLRPPPAEGELTATFVWLGRLSTSLVVASVLLAVFRWMRQPDSRREPGTWLRLGVLCYGGLVITAEFMVSGTVRQHWLMFVVFFLAAGADHVSPELVITWGKRFLLLFVVASAVALALNLPGAWRGGLGGHVLPVLDLRFQGIRSHPNYLGPYLVMFLLLDWVQPMRSRLRIPLHIAAVVMLVLTQSKTSWAAAVLVAVLLWAGADVRRRTQQFLVVGSVLVLAGFVMVAGDISPTEEVEPGGLDNVRTLTGRTKIWSVGVDAFLANPLSGGGPGIYRRYAAQTGQAFAGQAHNQVVQTAGEHGLLGLTGMAVYFFFLGRAAWRYRGPTGYASLALLGIFLIRSMTETPVDVISFEHLLVFVLLLAWERDHAGDRFASADEVVQLQVQGTHR